YVYVLNAATGKLIQNGSGTSIGKIALDPVGTSLGIAGYPNLIDADLDGIFDRVYVVDTAGRIYKVDLSGAAPLACQLASTGKSVFAGMAVAVFSNQTQTKVRLYLGGAPNPDGSSTPPPIASYHLFAFEDDDPLGSCTSAHTSVVFKAPIATPGKLWAAPA